MAVAKKIFSGSSGGYAYFGSGQGTLNYGGLEYEYSFSAGFANGNNSQNFSNFDEFSFSDLSVYATVTVDTQPEDWDDSSGWEIDIDDTINEDGVDYALNFEAQWIEEESTPPLRENEARYKFNLTDTGTVLPGHSAGYESSSSLFAQREGSIYRISENQSGGLDDIWKPTNHQIKLIEDSVSFTYLIRSWADQDITGHIVGETYHLSGIRDYDGAFHGSWNDLSVSSAIKHGYKFQGKVDIDNDGALNYIYTNSLTGRWASVALDPITGLMNTSDHGKGGETRIVGIYIDPLVELGIVIQGSDYDSQRRFQNDLVLDNLKSKAAGDYDGDGFQEVYWKTNDGTAYLRALMHADGNIQYANYQNEQQMSDYLTANGHASAISDIV